MDNLDVGTRKRRRAGISRDGRADEEAVVDDTLADVELGQLQQSMDHHPGPETVPCSTQARTTGARTSFSALSDTRRMHEEKVDL
eukprot:1926750-Rhodomonas_salina.1